MKKLMGITLVAVAAACGLYFMYLMAAPVAQGEPNRIETKES